MRKTLREFNLVNESYYQVGKYNAITDVPGVKVGQITIIKGKNIRTGVTVIIPPVDFSKNSLIAGGFIFNANGEVTGLHYIFEEARLISPIFLTNTLSVGDVFSAAVKYYQGKIALPVVGECWDGYLNDIYGRHIKKEYVFAALNSAKGEAVKQGNVGAGTGMTSFGFKGGIGTSSRKLKYTSKEYTIGILVNNNLGHDEGRHRYLRISGLEIGKVFEEKRLKNQVKNSDLSHSSAIIVVATDLPLTHHQLNRIAKHVTLGMGRVGIVSYPGSGDFVIAFSQANKIPKIGKGGFYKIKAIEESLLDNVFEATIEATEEAFLNSLLLAEDMEGRDGNKASALPIEKLLKNHLQRIN